MSRRRESANIGHRRHPEETEEAAACGAQRTLGPEPAPAPGSGHQRVQGRGMRDETLHAPRLAWGGLLEVWVPRRDLLPGVLTKV